MQKAAQMGYGIIARMPLQFGLLSGKIKPSQQFDEEDHRSFRLTSDIIQRTQDIIKTEMIPMAKQYNTTPAGLALSFVLNFTEVSTVIPGIRTPEHVQMNTMPPVKLSAFDFDYLQDLYASKWKAVADLMEKQG
jgi:aryl-alcohol dehydrogenase-like predicted oxidoreductase